MTSYRDGSQKTNFAPQYQSSNIKVNHLEFKKTKKTRREHKQEWYFLSHHFFVTQSSNSIQTFRDKSISEVVLDKWSKDKHQTKKKKNLLWFSNKLKKKILLWWWWCKDQTFEFFRLTHRVNFQFCQHLRLVIKN